jgi:hypothetical protein
MLQVALFTLAGVSTIVINHWSTTPEANMDLFKKTLRGSLAEGVYVGSAS